MENTTDTTTATDKLDQKQTNAVKKAILWAKSKLECSDTFIHEQLNDVQLSVNVLQFIYRGRVFELRKEDDERTQEQITHDSNKAALLGVGFAHYFLKYQARYKITEKDQAGLAIKVLEAIAKDFQAKIEAVEPPRPKTENPEPKKPYIIDATKVADEVAAVQ